MPTKAELVAAYSKFDADKSGTIDRDEFRAILIGQKTHTAADFKEGDADELLSLLASMFDKNGNGKFEIDELAEAMCTQA
eukprot:CAMPEP_0174730982 /NCGR_PEP_ID=MMETSP1094-20130205/56650_1 /TAXON_ID=156173 /ORGANISM="Chrysochromulina brevifilum, Strain UTEX LB 985" /LENGTH=79 /DNA_ID=CAMNT_0015933315 /DNA_START=8 /DNA_END=247 /DNA_ORIENTATION=-